MCINIFFLSQLRQVPILGSYGYDGISSAIFHVLMAIYRAEKKLGGAHHHHHFYLAPRVAKSAYNILYSIKLREVARMRRGKLTGE